MKIIFNFLFYKIRIADARRMLLNSGYDVSQSFSKNIFHSWRWSFKRPSHKQINKYKPENIAYYFTHLEEVEKIAYEKLYFLDESSLESRSLYRKQAISPKYSYQF